MTIQEVYLTAKKEKYPSLCLLIEFLVMEKKTLKFTDDCKELELYFKPNNHQRMNVLLREYKEQKYKAI